MPDTKQISLHAFGGTSLERFKLSSNQRKVLEAMTLGTKYSIREITSITNLSWRSVYSALRNSAFNQLVTKTTAKANGHRFCLWKRVMSVPPTFNRVQWMQEYRKTHPAREKRVYSESRREATRQWRGDNPERIKTYRKKAYLRTKNALLLLYGGACANCGCDDPRILELNHKMGGGAQDRKLNNNQNKIIHDIIAGRRRKEDFELTCKPCNTLHYVGMKYPEIGASFKIIWKGGLSVRHAVAK